MDGVEAQLEHLKTALERHDKVLYGNDGAPGMMTRLDRTEQAQANISRGAWAVLGIVLSLLAQAISKHL